MGVHLIDSALSGDRFGTEPMRRVFDSDAYLPSAQLTTAARGLF